MIKSNDIEALEEEIESLKGEIEDLKSENTDLSDRVTDLDGELSAAEDERNEAQSKLDDLISAPEMEAAANAVLAEVVRPVGKMNCMTLPDTEASRRALLALSDACGRVP